MKLADFEAVLAELPTRPGREVALTAEEFAWLVTRLRWATGLLSIWTADDWDISESTTVDAGSLALLAEVRG